MLKRFDKNEAPSQWFCQWKHGCILFALINSGMINSRFFSWLKPNEYMKTKSQEEKILFELKVITVWAFITGYYPFKHKETFYTIYCAFIRLTKSKAKMDEDVYRKKVSFYADKIKKLYDFFAIHENKSLNDGTWDAGKHIRLKVEDFTSLEDLPYKSLLCIENKHWVVYLGADGDYAIALDSLICDGYNKIPVSALKGQKIIKPKDIEIDYRMLESLLCDLNPNPYEILDIVKRREFSHKIAECIWRLEEISFTEHDYNRFVKQAKSALEKLDKEHYKYL